MDGRKQQRVRHLDRIRCSQLIDRVQAFALSNADPLRAIKLCPEDTPGAMPWAPGGALCLFYGRCKPDDPDALPCEMTGDQLRAAFKLIDKHVPDVRAVEVTTVQKVSVLDDLNREELMQLANGEVPERLDPRVLN